MASRLVSKHIDLDQFDVDRHFGLDIKYTMQSVRSTGSELHSVVN